MIGPGFVAMAVYRPDPALLKTQLESLQDQSLTDWTCLVGIDGSDPTTHRLLEQMLSDDPRFEILEFPDNVGVYRHFERLLELVPDEVAWVALADQDDRWYGEKLQVLVALLGAGVSAASGQARLVDPAGRFLGVTRRTPCDLTQAVLKNQLTGGFSVLRRDVIGLALPFPLATEIAIHDHWLAVCASTVGSLVIRDEPLQDYVQHASNVLGEEKLSSLRDTYGRIRSAGGPEHFLDQLATQRWGWRIEMTRALVDRRANLGPHETFVHAVAVGTLSRPIARAVFDAVRQGRLRIRAAVGATIAAWWYGRRVGAG